MHGFHARVELVQAFRVQFHAVQVVVQRVHGFLQLDARRFDQVDDRLQFRIDGHQLAQLLVQGRQLRHDRVVFRLGNEGQRFLRPFQQAGRVRQAAVLVRDLRPLAGLGSQFFQFAHLPFQAFALVQHVGGVGFEFFALAHEGAPALVQRRHLPRIVLHARFARRRLAVEQGALRLAFQQGLVRVLAVDIDQHVAQFAQLRGRGGDAVDVRLRAARIVDHAAQQGAALVVGKFVGHQPGLRHLADGKIGRDVGLGRTFAHHAGVAAPAQGQGQRIDEDGLAGARLTRQHAEAGGKFQFNGIDNDKIANGQCMEHGFCG